MHVSAVCRWANGKMSKWNWGDRTSLHTFYIFGDEKKKKKQGLGSFVLPTKIEKIFFFKTKAQHSLEKKVSSVLTCPM